MRNFEAVLLSACSVRPDASFGVTGALTDDRQCGYPPARIRPGSKKSSMYVDNPSAIPLTDISPMGSLWAQNFLEAPLRGGGRCAPRARAWTIATESKSGFEPTILAKIPLFHVKEYFMLSKLA